MEEPIVLDTNAYRDIVRRGFNVGEIREAERRASKTAYASAVTLVELASHIWDKLDPHCSKCRDAIGALHEHCLCSDTGYPRMLADGESLIAHMLYGQALGLNEQTMRRLMAISLGVKSSKGTDLPSDIIQSCQELHRQVRSAEDQFVRDMQDMVSLIDPSCVGWRPFAQDRAKRRAALSAIKSEAMIRQFAQCLVLKARALLDRPLNGPDLEGMTDCVRHRASGALELYRLVLVRLVETGSSLAKSGKANAIWDLNILIGVGQELGGQGAKLRLVSGDRAMVKAANNAGLGRFVSSLEAYLNEIGISGRTGNAVDAGIGPGVLV